MSSTDVRYPAASGGSSSPPVVTPHYASNLPAPPGDIENARHTRCATGLRFIQTVHGILDIIIVVALTCVIISAGVANRQNGIDADNLASENDLTNVKVSAFHTRNAVLVFAVFGLFLILVDIILHMTRLINRLPAIFDSIFIVIMLVLSGIYLILGCCAAAWEKKMRDTVGLYDNYQRPGAAASASFFLFVSMILIIIDFVLRLISRPSQSYNPSAIINRNAYDPHADADASSRF